MNWKVSESEGNLHTKPRLIILSDLWGKEKSDWVDYYRRALQQDFDIHLYDCCKLGEIDKSDYTQDALHKQFLNGGIEKAVQKLLTHETGVVTILAFSIGGTIAWQFALASQKVIALYCVSSTRLRNETIKPMAEVKLWYGAGDIFKPSSSWCDELELQYHLIQNKGHRVYAEPELAWQVSGQIVTDRSTSSET